MKWIIGSSIGGVILTSALNFGTSTTGLAADEFYKGKTVKVIVRSNPSGGYDFYGRLVARHISKHLPGNPRTQVVNMPGAGGIVAGNYIMNRAKKDGTEIAILTRELALAQRTKAVGVKYDLNRLIPIGSAASSTFLIVMGKNQPIKTYQQFKDAKTPVLFSATGPGAGSYQYPALLKNDGFNVKIITGFVGGQGHRPLSTRRQKTQEGPRQNAHSCRACHQDRTRGGAGFPSTTKASR